MGMKMTALALLMIVGMSHADDASILLKEPIRAEVPAPAIRFPQYPARATEPAGAKTTGSTERVLLEADTWYVIDFDNELIVDAISKDDVGSVVISYKKGPLHLPSKSAPGRTPDADDPEFTTIKGPHVYLVKAKEKGTVILEVIQPERKDATGKVLPFTKDNITRKTLDVLARQGPRPPPDVDPTPSAAPIPANGLHVLAVFDDKRPVPEDVASVIYGETVRGVLDSKCAKFSDGRPAYRIWGSSTQVVGKGEELWATAFARPRTSVPWLIVSNGKSGYEGPMPRTDKDGTAEQKVLKLIDKYSGSN